MNAHVVLHGDETEEGGRRVHDQAFGEEEGNSGSLGEPPASRWPRHPAADAAHGPPTMTLGRSVRDCRGSSNPHARTLPEDLSRPVICAFLSLGPGEGSPITPEIEADLTALAENIVQRA